MNAQYARVMEIVSFGVPMAAVTMAIAAFSAGAAESGIVAAESRNLPEAPLRSLCSGGEVAILDASVRPFGVPASKRIPTPARLVSICADRVREPYKRVTYRFGRPGQIEIQQTATPSRRFRLWTRSTSPHSGENIIGFSVGVTRYNIAIATLMGNGVIVRAFNGRRQLANLASGTTEGVDFRIGPAVVDFDRPSSPVFELGYPSELDGPVVDPSRGNASALRPK
jgi:hypothetical protein